MSITVDDSINSVVLTKNIGVSTVKQYTFGIKNTPGKTSPTVDTDTYANKPKILVIVAITTNTEKNTLDTIYDNSNEIQITTQEKKYDGWLIGLNHSSRVGYGDWASTLRFMIDAESVSVFLFKFDISLLDGTDVLA